MKIEWESKDIIGGRLVQKPGTGLTGAYIIGWRVREGGRGDDSNIYGLVSLADGMFIPVGSGIKEAVATHLNNTNTMPLEILSDGTFFEHLLGDVA